MLSPAAGKFFMSSVTMKSLIPQMLLMLLKK